MTKECAKMIVELIGDSDGYTAEIREDYSGRGMYGNATTGVVIDCTPFKAMCLAMAGVFAGMGNIAKNNPDIEYGDFENLQADQLGLGSIIY